MTTQSLPEEQTVEAAYDNPAEAIRNGLAGPEVERKDLPSVRAQALLQSGRKNTVYGALWFLGGILVTALTLAASDGDFCFLAYGAIIAGGIQFFVGLSWYSKGQRLLAEPVAKKPAGLSFTDLYTRQDK